MQITLNQSEIEEAIKTYMLSLGIGSDITDIDFTAGRGNTGISASIEIGSIKENPAKAPPASKVAQIKPLAEETEPMPDDDTDGAEAPPMAAGESLFT